MRQLGEMPQMKWRKVEQTLHILGRIAEGFRRNSSEKKAIRTAAEALFYVSSSNVKDRFAKFMLKKNRTLTRAQILHLRAIGVDPNEQRVKRDRRTQHHRK
jgi:hypothetical protein